MMQGKSCMMSELTQERAVMDDAGAGARAAVPDWRELNGRHSKSLRECIRGQTRRRLAKRWLGPIPEIGQSGSPYRRQCQNGADDGDCLKERHRVPTRFAGWGDAACAVEADELCMTIHDLVPF